VRDNRAKLAGLLRACCGASEGWHLGTEDGTQGGGEYWRLGVAGALRLTIGPEMDGFLACVHDQVLGDG